MYTRGVLPKRKLRNVWRFKEEAIAIAKALGRDGDGATILARALIRVLEELDLVFEHSGLLGDDASSDQAQEYYLIPEVWSRRLDEQGRLRTDAQASPSTYDSRTHMMIGRQVDVEGWLLPSFFRKFVCKCATALAHKDNLWKGGRVTLARDALRWESATWPGKEKALALWVESSEQTIVTVKVVGLRGEKYVMRELSAMVAKTLQDVADAERVSIVRIARRRVGTLPPEGSASDELAWVDEGEAEKRIQSGECVMRLEYNGDIAPVPLYLFDSSASLWDVIPNFDAEQMVPRRAHDPEYLIHCRGFKSAAAAAAAATKPPAHLRQVMDTVSKVTAGRWGTSFIGRLLTKWSVLLEREEIRKRVQVVDVSQYGTKGGPSYADYQLLVCLPFRNLYVSTERYHSMVLEEFSLEVLRMLGALRAKRATITIRSSDECSRQSTGWLGFWNWGIGSSSQNRADAKAYLPFSRKWDPPQSGPEDAYPLLDEEAWYYLDESCAACRTKFRGLDLTGARNSILSMKASRVHGGTEIGKATVKLFFSKSDELGLSGSYQGFEAQFGGSNKTESTLEMEYEAQMYNWNEDRQEWEWE